MITVALNSESGPFRTRESVLSRDYFIKPGSGFSIEQRPDLFTGFPVNLTTMHRLEAGLVFKFNDRCVVPSL